MFKLVAEQSPVWRDNEAPSGIVLGKIFIGADPDGLGGFQVAVAQSTAQPKRETLSGLFNRRRGKKQISLVVVVTYGESAYLYGPDPQNVMLQLPVSLAERYLQSVLDEPDDLAARQRFSSYQKALETTTISGFTNSGLFASHHIRENVPKRPDWAELAEQAAPVLHQRGARLIEALGFKSKVGVGNTLLLSANTDAPQAVAVLLDETEQFDAKSPRFQLTPVAFGLNIAARQEVPWLLVLRKDQIRLYPGRDGVGVGQKGQTETFFEVDLSTIDDEYSALLPLIFSATALEKQGTATELLEQSNRYATALGTRLRERIYDDVVPRLAKYVASQLPQLGIQVDPEGLATAYRLTLRILFRLLFQAYAEDRQLLPAGRNERYDANSLKTIAQRDMDTDIASFSSDAASIWLDLVQVWNAIDQGNPLWNVPAYNGGLFAADSARSAEGALIAKLSIPDSVVGPALKSLLVDISEDGVLGPVDFRSLSVREFGTIYEGLLESSLSLADTDLTTDMNDAWVPAKPGEDVKAAEGTVYFHSASGERKATGSYFTPKVVVDHLIDRSVKPALHKHLQKIDGYLRSGDEVRAAREFFDFRVADLAMGSGHFLVAAVDKIEAMMRSFLTEHEVTGVREELIRLAGVAKDMLGDDEVAKAEVDEVNLLRRQIARRCVYGLDINPLAVELARLALWIHTFVPGLPMSNLDHGLVCANSLTGIGTVGEALDALQPRRDPGQVSFFDEIILNGLATSKVLLVDLANADEADKAQADEAAQLLADARKAAEPTRKIFDAAVAARIGRIQAGIVLTEEDLTTLTERGEVEEAAQQLQPAHMPYLFPEVFIRDNPGFDVLLGNPPWEKVKVETDQWWGLRIPRLRSMPQKQKNAALKEFQNARPDLMREFEDEVAAVDAFRAVLIKGPFPGLGSGGDPDLYQAFAWRNWQLLREGGRSAVVLPRGALSGSALARWRQQVLDEGSFADVCFLINTNKWIFEGVDGRYTVGLTVAERGGESIVRFAGPFGNEKDFMEQATGVAEVPATEFVEWSSTAAFPLIPDPKSAEIFRLMKQQPRFDNVRDNWEFRPFRELDATNDKKLLEFDIEEVKGRIPVYAGASFNLWDPDAGEPYAYSEPQVLRAHLENKLERAVRTARSAYYRIDFLNGELPLDRPRIAFRDVTNQTNTRTTIAALIPPGTSVVHTAPVLVPRKGGVRAEAFLLGVLSSVPFDWASRRWVELHLTFELLNALPIPERSEKPALSARVVEIAGRLAAVDDRYAEWAAAVGVPFGSVDTPARKDDLIAELDALVSLLYGLSEDQVEHVFSTFHRGWSFESRLTAVLAHYRVWKAKQ